MSSQQDAPVDPYILDAFVAVLLLRGPASPADLLQRVLTVSRGSLILAQRTTIDRALAKLVTLGYVEGHTPSRQELAEVQRVGRAVFYKLTEQGRVQAEHWADLLCRLTFLPEASPTADALRKLLERNPTPSAPGT